MNSYGQNLFRISRSGLDFVSRGNIKSAEADRMFLLKDLSFTQIICLSPNHANHLKVSTSLNSLKLFISLINKGVPVIQGQGPLNLFQIVLKY